VTYFGKTVLAGAGIAALAISAPASATSFTGFGAAFIPDGNGAFFDTAIGAGSFTDIIDFNLSSAGTLTAGVLYLDSVANITGLTATLNGSALTFTPSGNGFQSGTISLPVLAGAQQIVINGLSYGGGSYTGSVSFAAVPETGTWAMMILGLALAGAALRRRSKAYEITRQSVSYAAV
jgi:hypothetical protein